MNPHIGTESKCIFSPSHMVFMCVGGSWDPSRAGAVGEGEEPPHQRAEEDK